MVVSWLRIGSVPLASGCGIMRTFQSPLRAWILAVSFSASGKRRMLTVLLSILGLAGTLMVRGAGILMVGTGEGAGRGVVRAAGLVVGRVGGRVVCGRLGAG
jgi:hypothetical protein